MVTVYILHASSLPHSLLCHIIYLFIDDDNDDDHVGGYNDLDDNSFKKLVFTNSYILATFSTWLMMTCDL